MNKIISSIPSADEILRDAAQKAEAEQKRRQALEKKRWEGKIKQQTQLNPNFYEPVTKDYLIPPDKRTADTPSDSGTLKTLLPDEPSKENTPPMERQGMGPQIFNLKNSSYTKQVHKGRPVDEEFIAERRKTTQEGIDSAESYSKEKSSTLDRHAKIYEGWVQGLKEKEGALATDSAEAKTAYNNAAVELDKARKNIAEAKVDPDRYWNNLSTTQKSMKYISAIFSGFAHGFSGGKIKNTGVEMIENAIKRDIAAQRMNIQKKIASYSISAAEKQHLYKAWQGMEERKRGLATDMVKMQLGQMALESKRPDIAYQASLMIQRLKGGLAKDIHGEFAANQNKVTTSSTTTKRQQVVMPKSGSGTDVTGGVKFPERKAFASRIKSVRALRELKRSLIKHVPLGIAGKLSGKQTERFLTDRERIASAYIHAQSGANVTEAEFNRKMKVFPSPASLTKMITQGGSKEAFKTQLYKINQLIKQEQGAVNDMLKSNPNLNTIYSRYPKEVSSDKRLAPR